MSTVSEPRREPFTAADLEWAAEALNAGSEVYTVVGCYDAMAAWPAERRGQGVRLDAGEEAAMRFNLPDAGPEAARRGRRGAVRVLRPV